MSFLYREVLGAAWDRLPAVTRALHSPDPVVVFKGEATISRGTNVLARGLADRLGLPPAGKHVAQVTVSRPEPGAEHIERCYGPARLTTHQFLLDKGHKLYLGERFGPFLLCFDLSGHEKGIDFALRQVRLWGLTLPRGCAPQVQASERADQSPTGDGVHIFDVEVRLPGLGRLIAYQGRLERFDP